MVVVGHRVREDLDIVAKGLRERFLDPLHCLIGLTVRFVLEVESGEEPSLEAHLGKEARVGGRVPKVIDVPAAAGLGIVTKLTLDELVTNHHIVDHIVVVGRALVMHGPASVDKLQAALLDQLADVILLMVGLHVPPHGEVLHLDLSVALILVVLKLDHNRVNNVANVALLDILGRASEVLINSFEPADIVVAVRHQVNVQVFVSCLEARFELFPLHLREQFLGEGHVGQVCSQGRFY